MALIVISFMVNVVVFGLLPIALLGRSVLIENTFGPNTPARRILATLYGTIALSSLAALISVPILKTTDIMIHIALVLLPFQIVHLIMTRAVFSGSTPLVIANFVIAALHILTLVVYGLS